VSPISITFVIVLFIIVLFIGGRVPVVLVALGCSLALYATGVLTMTQALAGLGDPVVILIAGGYAGGKRELIE